MTDGHFMPTPARPTAKNAPPAGRRERRRADTHRRILDAALALFAKNGFANTSVEAITAAADVGKGTFFNYFPTKEHLLLAFGERQVGKLASAAHAIDRKVPVKNLVLGAVHQIASEWLRGPRLLRSLVGTILSNDMLAERFDAFLAAGRQSVSMLMAEGQRRGELRADIPAIDLARLLQQLMIGTQIVWSVQRGADLDERIAQALDVFWRGIAATAPARRATRRARQ